MRPITLREERLIYIAEWDEDDGEVRPRYVGEIEDGKFRPALAARVYPTDAELAEIRRRYCR